MDLMTLAMTSKIMGGGGSGDDLTKYFEDRHATVDISNATKIKKYAFYNDRTIKNIIMPKVTSIGEGAFQLCTVLALTSLPNGVITIDGDAFNGCARLALTSLPSGLTTIGNRAFNECSVLKITEIPSGVTSIGNNAFIYCSNLSSLTFKGTPTSISSNAFQSCSNLKTINVPWAQGAVSSAPWGATNATINYNYKG